MKILEGDAILIVLQNPREKIWGVMRELNPAGVFVKGIDLNSFEDFVLSAVHREPFYGLSEQFVPMWRVERIAKDLPDGDIPSMQNQFEQRTRTRVSEFFGENSVEN